jgi:radical SAM superfamily enzyme YgiQ (UPF0313 family)
MPKIHLILMPEYHDPRGQPPLGIACLGAYLKNNGVDVTCTDFRLLFRGTYSPIKSKYDYGRTAYVYEIPDLPLIISLVKNYKEGKPLLYGFEDVILDYIKHRSVNYFTVKSSVEEMYAVINRQIKGLARHEVVGFSTVFSNLFFTVMLSLLLRRENPGIKIIYGGPQVTLSVNSAKLVLKLGIADVVIPGEGEAALLRVIRSYEKGKSPSVEGTIIYDSGNESFSVKPSNSLLNLDTLPDPDFSIFQLERYSPLALPLYASRGCVFRCRFCTVNKLFPFRYKDPVKVVDCMEHLHRRFNTIRFRFTDSALNISREWLEHFAGELIRRKCNFQWGAFFKPWMSEKLLNKLIESGLYTATFGVETFSDRLLGKMGKGNTNTKDIIKTIELSCSAGIQVYIGLIVGFPGETKADFSKTWKAVLELSERYPQNFNISPLPFQLMPSSRCFEKYRECGLILKKWDSKTGRILPEVKDIIKNMPMIFSARKPGSAEVVRRFEMMENIFRHEMIYLSEAGKIFLRECLKRVKGSSIVSPGIGFEISSYTQGLDKKEKQLFLINYQSNKLVLSEKEAFIINCLSGKNSLSATADMLSCRYRRDRRASSQAILKFLDYLIDNDFPLKIKI